MHLRHYEIVTDADKLNVDIQATCMKYTTIKQWAYILHDKDETRDHYHIYVNFGTSVDSKLVAEWFKVPENFISKIKGRKADVLMYLTHENESQKYKHVYDRSEIHANFDVGVEIEQAKIIGDFKNYSYAQQLAYVETLPIDEKIKTFNRLKKLWELYCQTQTLNSARNLQVVFICGKGGTGKTYYAKKMLESMGLDYCVSSSSNDPFQDYMGQKAMILDDLRDTAFRDGRSDGFDDLLKILDNNTSSSVKSRFNNKVFNGEVIVITSTVPIKYWFSSRKSAYNGYDDLSQLYRRIGTYIEVKETEITVYDEGLIFGVNSDENGKPKGTGTVYQNELVILKKQQQKNNCFISVFDKMCKTVPTQISLVEDNFLPF